MALFAESVTKSAQYNIHTATYCLNYKFCGCRKKENDREAWCVNVRKIILNVNLFKMKIKIYFPKMQKSIFHFGCTLQWVITYEKTALGFEKTFCTPCH